MNRPLRVNFVALGCAKNLVDSEKMLGLLAEGGLTLVGPDERADVTIINTCGFIEDARQEAMEQIALAAQAKERGQTAHIIVAGCLAQLWGKKIQEQVPAVDAVVGLGDRDSITQIVREIGGKRLETGGWRLEGKSKTADARPLQSKIQNPKSKIFKGPVLADQARLRLTEPVWTYLRVSEGCNQGCTFCTIPAIRGPFRSKTPDAILAEAREMIADGVLELNLIGQETSTYGGDLGYRGGLGRLLRELNQLEGLRWLRVLYTHPASMTDGLIAALAQCDKVVPYLDMPLQHINNRILKLMHRRISRAATEKLLQKLRRQIPGITLRTTMLVGFPSETPAEFQELLDFVREFRFAALGAFAYSPEERTAAARLPGQLPEEVKQERRERLMLAQQEIAFESAESYIGRQRDCLILGSAGLNDLEIHGLDRRRRWFLGRHPGQAPEIDSVCLVAAAPKSAPPAGIVPVSITRRAGYDLVGKL